MRLLNGLLLALLILNLSSCNLIWEHRELHEFESFKWDKSNAQTFEFEIDEKGKFQIDIIGRHLTGFPYPTLNCQISVIGDSIEFVDDTEIPIIAEDGTYLTEGSGDFWDFDFPSFQNLSLEKGTYKAVISPTNNDDPIRLISEIGIEVKRVD